MPPDRLSPLDASFLAVEGPAAHMHVGWAAFLDPPPRGRPSGDALAAHVAGRLDRAPRWRQRLAPVPLGLHEPVWVDDPAFDPAEHLHVVAARDVGALVGRVMSVPLDRDRPLWEMWIADGLDDGRIAVVGKAHHCMVDGIAALELASVLLDRDPVPPTAPAAPAAPAGAGPATRPPRTGPAAPPPGAAERALLALRDRARDHAALAGLPLRLATGGGAGAAVHAAASLARAALPLAPPSSLNHPGSPQRHLACVTRPVEELRAIRRRWAVTINDAILGVCAGALRRFALRRGEAPAPLKVMVPVNVRAEGDALGNRITFLFVALPCEVEDPVVRLMLVHRETATRKRRGEAGGTDAVMRALALTPRVVRRAAAQLVASPRMYNLVVSSLPGPRFPVHLGGCRLRAIHPVVPLAERHALSIGVCTVAGDACFGLYADRATLPETDGLAADLGAAFDELLALT